MTVSYTPAQTGYEDALNVWHNTAALGLGTNFGPWSGLQFTVPAPNELMYRSLTLSLHRYGGPATSTGTLTIGLVNNIAEPVFSATNLPSNQNLIPLYNSVYTFDYTVNPDPILLTLNLGVSTPPTGSFVGGSLEVAGQVLDHSSFGGNLALVLSYTDFLVTFLPVSLVGDEVPYLSGLPSSKTRLSRADWCPRCGTPIFREQLMEDGFTRSLVCSDCWDRGEQRYPPYKPPKEINP